MYDWADIEAALQHVATVVDAAPTAAEYRAHRRESDPTARTIINRLKDSDDPQDQQRPWIRALVRAGLDPDPARHTGSSYRLHDYREGIQYVAAQDAAWPTGYRYRQVYDDEDLAGVYPSKGRIQHRYGGWEDAREDARTAAPQWLQTLVAEGPQPAGDLGKIPLDHPLRPTRVSVGQATVHSLPGHEDRPVLVVLVRQLLPSDPSQADLRSTRQSLATQLSGTRKLDLTEIVNAAVDGVSIDPPRTIWWESGPILFPLAW